MKPISFRIDDEAALNFEQLHRDLLRSGIRLKKSDSARTVFERGIKDIQINGLPTSVQNTKSKDMQ
jgi:hypothetical protein